MNQNQTTPQNHKTTTTTPPAAPSDVRKALESALASAKKAALAPFILAPGTRGPSALAGHERVSLMRGVQAEVPTALAAALEAGIMEALATGRAPDVRALASAAGRDDARVGVYLAAPDVVCVVVVGKAPKSGAAPLTSAYLPF